MFVFETTYSLSLFCPLCVSLSASFWEFFSLSFFLSFFLPSSVCLIAAIMNCKLWVIDGQAFQSIMLTSGLLRISQSLDLLRRSSPLVTTLTLSQTHLFHSNSPTSYCHSPYRRIHGVLVNVDAANQSLWHDESHLCLVWFVCSESFFRSLPEDALVKVSDALEEVRHLDCNTTSLICDPAGLRHDWSISTQTVL